MKSQGFIIDKIYCYEERGFFGAKPALNEKGLELLVVAKGDHVGVAEKTIRLIKERARCIVAELPYTMPKSFTKYLAYYTCNQINAIPRITSSSACSPRESV